MSKKSVVVAGNGPSLKNIDYSRLPKEFDIFRCNQFFFEDKYYLGKNVTGYFVGIPTVEHLFTTSVVLESRKEYFFEERYYTGLLFEGIHDSRRMENLQFPTLINSFDFLEKNKKIKKFLAEQYIAHNKWPTTGIWMVLTAVVMGYTDIYFVGVDLYSGDSLYAYNNYQPKNFTSVHENTNALDGAHHHSLEIEYATMELVKTFEDVTIHTISPNHVLQDIFPLAPVQNDSTYVPEDKPEGYLNDIVFSKRQQEKLKQQQEKLKQQQEKLKQQEEELKQQEEELKRQEAKGKTQKLKQKFNEKGLDKEWEFLRDFWLTKFLFQSAKFVYVCLKIVKSLLKK